MTSPGWMSCSLLGAVAALAGCADIHDFEGTSCPCPAGYSCRLDDNVCFATERIAPPSGPVRCTIKAPECTQSERVLTDRFTSAQAAREVVTGRWLMCEGMVLPAVVVEPDFRGYDLKANGTWTRLKEVAPGVCEEDSGFGREGRWDVRELEGGEPGQFQVVTGTTGAPLESVYHTPIIVSAFPRKLNFLVLFTEVVADPQPPSP